MWFLLPPSLVAGGPDAPAPFPSFDQAVKMAVENHPGEPKYKVEYEVGKYYFQFLAKEEQLGISEEVRGHFEKAVTKAEERMDSDEGEVSQSAVTKLKLGLSGTQNDISGFSSEKNVARLYLGYWLGNEIDPDAKPLESSVSTIDFPHATLEEYEKFHPGGNQLKGMSLVKVEEAMLNVVQSRARLKLARKTRKITRALLVTEVANYDFGIGNEGDLFESLIIYTKVLVGYYESIYQFNLSVLEFKKLYSELSA